MNTPITHQQPKPCNEVDMEELANEALSINMAVDWITRANTVIHDVCQIAGAKPEFRQVLDDWNVRYRSPDWSDSEMDEHVSRLLNRQISLIKRMAEAAA